MRTKGDGVATRFETVDDYIASFPAATQPVLSDVRRAILETAPEAREKISYGMATYTIGGKPLIYFAGWKQHIGIYPVPRGDASFEAEVAPYRGAKDTVRIPLATPLPAETVCHIVTLVLEQRAAESDAAEADKSRG